MRLIVRLMLCALVATGQPAGLARAAGAGADEGGGHLLVMGAIGDDPRRNYAHLRPMADYVAPALRSAGVSGVEILIVDTRDQLIRLMRHGRVDWVSETAYSAVMIEQQAGGEIVLRKWKQGVPEYHSIVFARDDSPVRTLGDLRGHSIAFQHPGSTTGYFVPGAALIDQGLGLARMVGPGGEPPVSRVGYLFSGAEYNTAVWVHKRLVDAGVVSNLDWEDDNRVPRTFRDDFRILYRSGPIPRAVELIRGNLDHGVKEALVSLLLDAHLDPRASAALAGYHATVRFDHLDEQAAAGLERIRDSIRGQPQLATPTGPGS